MLTVHKNIIDFKLDIVQKKLVKFHVERGREVITHYFGFYLMSYELLISFMGFQSITHNFVHFS